MKRKLLNVLMIVTLLGSMLVVLPVGAKPTDESPGLAEEAAIQQAISATILHTNDFHGYLETDYRGRGGSAYMATVINDIRADKGADNVLLMDAGDVYLGAAPISQLLLGESSIDIYNMLGYDVAAYGNHEFDKGQTVLISRTNESNFPWIGANIVLEGTDWQHPDWSPPYVTLTVGTAPNQVTLGVIGVDTDETPLVTLKGTTEGLEFKDIAEAILHYYDEVKGLSDALVVLAHMGTEDSGPYKGLVTVAEELLAAGKPVDLIIGGHQHQALFEPEVVADTTYIVQAGYYGRYLGQVDVSIDPATKSLSVLDYTLHTINDTITPTAEIAERVAYWAEQVAPIVNQPVGQSNIDLVRDYNAESIMGNLVADGMLWKADMYDDNALNGSVDIAFTNPGGLRADITSPDGTYPFAITWGDTFNVLPFGNMLYYMDVTGAQVEALLLQAAKLYKGMAQTAGLTFEWYNVGDESQAWDVRNIQVGSQPLDLNATYRLVTNDFLAGGQDGWVTLAEGTNRWNSYVDMQEGVNEYIQTVLGGTIEATDIITGRALSWETKTVTILHTNDTHGRWEADYYHGGMVYLADLIKAERAANPDVLLLDAGDTFQGNAFAQFFRNATPNPIAGGMNMLDYDAMVIGNHEYNFGSQTFKTMLSQVDFPLLGSLNVDDDGRYGLADVGVQDYITLTVDGLDVVIFGLTNPRVYRYELPTNIEGLTFYPATSTAQSLVPQLLANENPDLLVGLTHIGYSPYGDELDSDLLVAQEVTGIDVIVGGHSHTMLDPAVMVTSTVNPAGTLIAQALRYAGYLGKVNVSFAEVGGSYEMVNREGYLLSASDVITPDAELETYLQPFLDELDAYTSQEIGQTLVPIDALEAYTEETNGANLQVDAAEWQLEQAGIPVDFHLSGAMSNRKVAYTATLTNPTTLTIDDMYTLMPYENSLVAFDMNGAQLKRVLERSYRNYYYYKYVPGYGGYSHYTTCMLDISQGGQITYLGTRPDGNNVLSVKLNGVELDLTENTTYTVSTVNYVAAGSCNFNDEGITIWPLDQIVADTQYYVRDAVIAYLQAQTAPIAPAVEGRLVFQEPDLSTSTKTVVDASGDGQAEAGEILTYTIDLVNTGTYGAGLVLTDTLPAGLTFVGDPVVSSPGNILTFTVTGDTLVVHTLGRLYPPAGSSLLGMATIDFAAQVSDPAPTGTITNTAQLVDQLRDYTLEAAIPVPVVGYKLFLPVIVKNF